MFDIGAAELLVIVIVAIVVIGPKDLPLALRTAGRWIGKVRRVSNHFRAGIDTMIREAEMEEMEKKWAEQNAKIMAQHPDTPGLGEHEMQPLPPPDPDAPGDKRAQPAAPPPSAGEPQPPLPKPPSE